MTGAAPSPNSRRPEPSASGKTNRCSGYQEGGAHEWASYSPVFGTATLDLFRQAEATA